MRIFQSIKKTLLPEGITIVEGDAMVPIQNLAEKHFERLVKAHDLEARILELRYRNAEKEELLAIIFYVSVGPDGSTGHHFHKTENDSSQ